MGPSPLALPTINLAIILLSCLPMYWGDKASVKGDVFCALVWLWTSIVAAFVFLGIRWFEVLQLGYRWDTNVFGSIVWTALVLHTIHVLASAVESIVLAVVISIRGIDSHLHGRLIGLLAKAREEVADLLLAGRDDMPRRRLVDRVGDLPERLLDLPPHLPDVLIARQLDFGLHGKAPK